MITINYLHHDRSMFRIFFHFLNKIERDDIHINILTDTDNGDFWRYILKGSNKPCDVVVFPKGLNYMEKIFYAASNSDDIAVKLDEDIFIHNKTWEHIFDNLDKLNDPNCLCVIPTISNGIPGCDYFLEDFLTKDEQQNINKLLLQTHVPPNGGSIGGGYMGDVYDILNQHTINAQEWSSYNWWNTVRHINFHYRGIHPLRINHTAQLYLLDVIRCNYNRFCEQENRTIHLEKSVYMCNGMFAIKTELWKKILSDPSLFVDAFDEVPINKYKDKHDMYVARSSGWGIHPCYNSMPNLKTIEDEFYLDFMSKVIKYDENNRS